MAQVQYQLPLGSYALYPPYTVLSPNPPANVYPLGPQPPTRAFSTMNDVVQYWTASSLLCEGFSTIQSLTVSGDDVREQVTITIVLDDAEKPAAQSFQAQHLSFLAAGQLANSVTSAMTGTPAWNPMANYPVNKHDGKCVWSLFLPLGMAMQQQRAVVLMHYPPIIAMIKADYLHNNTLDRWRSVLMCCDATVELGRYTTIIDVNPIAAPGSGQSEYPNDYFPIMMSSYFFDSALFAPASYIRAMALTLLNPQGSSSSLPLMICGSPAYDPQAPGWFRAAFKDQMPQDATGIPQADVLQTGTVTLHAGRGPTPYVLANHMIAAGVEGRNTGTDWANSNVLPDVRLYEALDLVATTALLDMGQGTDPVTARRNACLRWFGIPDVPSPFPTPTNPPVPLPPAAADRACLCALALVDLYFDESTAKPCYTFEQAMHLVNQAVEAHGGQMPPSPAFQYPIAYNPCDTSVYPKPAKAKQVAKRALASA